MARRHCRQYCFASGAAYGWCLSCGRHKQPYDPKWKELGLLRRLAVRVWFRWYWRPPILPTELRRLLR